MTGECSPIEWETNKLFPEIKKQSCRNYNSFDVSPPIEGIVDPREASKWPSCLRAAGDESRPLISKHNSLCYKNTEGAGNEHDCFAKKDRFYNKVLPFPIVSRSFGSQECSGAVNSLVKFDDDTNSHSVSLNYGKDVECKGNNFSVFQKPVVARDTMILCNDLDSDCQVVPLSFSPNVHPDTGSVPLSNCQVSMNNSVPQGTLVSSSCNSNSLVTLLNQTKDSIQPASWPRRRPQSLRVAMCYSDPEHLQSANMESLSSVANLQEIALADMRGSSQVEGSSSTSISTNVLSSIVDPKNRGTQEETKTERPLSRNVGEREKPPLENKGVTRQGKPDRVTIMNTSYRDSILKPSDISNESTLMSLAAAETVLKSSALLYPLLHAAQNYGGFNDGSLRSPSSDKENDPAMLSVRPKVKSIGSSHSPKRKKTSPLRKNRSPRRQRSDSIKETHPKLLLPRTCERRRSENVCVTEDDVWAVDDFLPVSKSAKTRSNIVEVRSSSVKLSPTSTVKSSVSGVETKNASKSDHIKGGATPLLDDVDLSMINSTFSTDTGYETETNTNSVSTEDCITVRDEAKKSKEVTSPRSVTRGNSAMDGMNFLPCVPSPHTTPVNISGTTTPNTVTEDLTDYYSICSELANLASVSNNIYQRDAGDDTADYLSITSEMPGAFKLPEDSPCADLDAAKQGFADEPDSIDPTSRLSTQEQTLNNPANEESVAAVDDPEMEDALSPHEDVSSDQSQSNSSLPSPVDTPSQELVEVKYMQLSLSIVLAIVLHAMQSISQFMLEIFLATEQEDRWD